MKNFNEIYEKVYKESNDTLEKARNRARNGIIWITFIMITIGTILSIMTKSPFFIFGTFLIIALYMGFSKDNKNYINLFKEKVIKTFVKEYSETLEYIPNLGISKQIYRNGEFENFDTFYSEDLIKGTLDGNYKINMSEVHTEKESKDEDGHTTYYTVFRGLFAEIILDKNVKTKLKIRKDNISLFGKKDKIKMDSSEFEKIFNVYSTDKIIAMQLLTSDIMQMFIEFKEENKLTPELTIKDNTLYIRFETGAVFEPKLLKKSLEFDFLLKYYNIINFTLGLTEKMIKNIKETEI